MVTARKTGSAGTPCHPTCWNQDELARPPYPCSRSRFFLFSRCEAALPISLLQHFTSSTARVGRTAAPSNPADPCLDCRGGTRHMPCRSRRSMMFSLLAATSAQTHRNSPGQTDRHRWELDLVRRRPSTPNSANPACPAVRRQVDITRRAIHRSASCLVPAKSPRASLAYLSARARATFCPRAARQCRGQRASSQGGRMTSVSRRRFLCCTALSRSVAGNRVTRGTPHSGFLPSGAVLTQGCGGFPDTWICILWSASTTTSRGGQK